MNHTDLCERAAAWLRSSGRCDPVLNGIGSAYEIPDAIGWNTGGSIVIECKTSRIDFLRDRKKYVRLRRPDGWVYQFKRLTKKQKIEQGFVEEQIPNMGDRRYFLCPPEVASADDIKKLYPDHGLFHLIGRRLQQMLDAPKREHVSHQGEVRYLRFALIHARDNLLKNGFVVDLPKLTQFFGEDGIVDAQQQKERSAPLFAIAK